VRCGGVDCFCRTDFGPTVNPGRYGAEKCFGIYPPNATESGRPTSPEFETTNGGIWRICAVIDYVTKYNGHHRHPYQPQHRCAALPATCRH